MNVTDLIAKLQQMPPDAVVLLDGYEGAMCDVRCIASSIAYLNARKDSWLGPHEVERTYYHLPENAAKVSCVYIGRYDL